MNTVLTIFAAAAFWVGHACIWTFGLNNLYGRAIPKKLLKPWRLLCGLVIAAGLPLAWWLSENRAAGRPLPAVAWAVPLSIYAAACSIVGLVVFPLLTLLRLLRRPPREVLRQQTRTLDLWKELGEAAVGDGHWRQLTKLPGNGVFRVDFTELTLAPAGLPAAWDGLTVLMLSDLHFHGTPSRAFFERVLAEIEQQPPADVVALVGDYVDTETHHEWIGPLLGRLKWKEHGFAILGNHDDYHDPDRVRGELQRAGYALPSPLAQRVTIRGEPCVVIGHEGPWFPPPADPPAAEGAFRLCLSHSPDNFYWAQGQGVNLLLSGHVHGGQVRLPVVGSIFVPSVYSRRFDMGVFAGGGTLMVVGRGLSGREPLRVRCNPQVIRLTLVKR